MLIIVTLLSPPGPYPLRGYGVIYLLYYVYHSTDVQPVLPEGPLSVGPEGSLCLDAEGHADRYGKVCRNIMRSYGFSLLGRSVNSIRT